MATMRTAQSVQVELEIKRKSVAHLEELTTTTIANVNRDIAKDFEVAIEDVDDRLALQADCEAIMDSLQNARVLIALLAEGECTSDAIVTRFGNIVSVFNKAINLRDILDKHSATQAAECNAAIRPIRKSIKELGTRVGAARSNGIEKGAFLQKLQEPFDLNDFKKKWDI